MGRAIFYILHQDNAWRIRLGKKLHGPYLTQIEAINKAVDAAQSAGQRGHDTLVLVQGRDSQWNTEWVYGYPYPHPPKN